MSVFSTFVKMTGNRSHTTVMVVRLFMCGMFVTTFLFYCLCAVELLMCSGTFWLECPHLYAYMLMLVLMLMCSVQFGWNVVTYIRLTFTVSIQIHSLVLVHLRPLSLCIHIPLLNRPWTFNVCIGRPDGRWIFITWSAGGALNVVCVCRDDARAINLPTHKCQSSRGDQTGGRAAGRSQPTDRPSAANPPPV